MSSPPTPLPGWPYKESPFHEAELKLQDRFGFREKLDAGVRRGIRAELIEQHRAFFAQLPLVLVGSVDQTGQPWASMLTGRPGFISSPDPLTLCLNALPCAEDPAAQAMGLGSPVGILGIEPHTRRRNRMNGTIVAADGGGVSIRVVQSYGNCPQYIQGRQFTLVQDPSVRAQARGVLNASQLSAQDMQLLRATDTFFIATANLADEAGTARGADVSHRGGRPDFIRVDDERTITTPDFVGNYFFNTIGNLQLEPRAGLLIPDFDTGDILQLAVRTEVIWSGPEVEAFAGAQRLLRFHVEAVIRLQGVLPIRGSSPVYARELAATGTWTEAQEVLTAKEQANTWRDFSIVSVQDETPSVRSFLLEPLDGKGIVPNLAGQFLPIRLPSDGAAALIRTYTVSDASDGRRYRISVKREGSASQWLFANARPGSTLQARAPRGGFVFEPSTRPVVLLSAGIGVTPMIAMLNSLLVNDMRSRHGAQILFIHGSRSSREHPFAAHVRHKAKHHANLRVHVAYSAPDPQDALGRTHDSEGRIGAELLSQLLPLNDVDVYLCGPSAFMQEQYDNLLAIGVSDARIRFESFGPSSLTRVRSAKRPDGGGAAPVAIVRFVRSGVEAAWRPEQGTLLDLAEEAGVAAASSCRSGTCGTCATGLLEGDVRYEVPPLVEVASGLALICCARPVPGTLALDL